MACNMCAQYVDRNRKISLFELVWQTSKVSNSRQNISSCLITFFQLTHHDQSGSLLRSRVFHLFRCKTLFRLWKMWTNLNTQEVNKLRQSYDDVTTRLNLLNKPSLTKHSNPSLNKRRWEQMMDEGEDAESVCRSSYENSYNVIRTGAQQKFVSNLILKTLLAMWWRKVVNS